MVQWYRGNAVGMLLYGVFEKVGNVMLERRWVASMPAVDFREQALNNMLPFWSRQYRSRRVYYVDAKFEACSTAEIWSIVDG